LGYFSDGSSVEKVDNMDGDTSIAWTDWNDLENN